MAERRRSAENYRAVVLRTEEFTGRPAKERRTVDIPDDVIDKAFAVYEEFGPDRRIDRRERLRTVLHLPSAEAVERIMECMKSISDTVWNLARQGGEMKMGRDRVLESLRAEHPYLKTTGLRKAVFLVNYFAWHEGYDR